MNQLRELAAAQEKGSRGQSSVSPQLRLQYQKERLCHQATALVAGMLGVSAHQEELAPFSPAGFGSPETGDSVGATSLPWLNPHAVRRRAGGEAERKTRHSDSGTSDVARPAAAGIVEIVSRLTDTASPPTILSD